MIQRPGREADAHGIYWYCTPARTNAPITAEQLQNGGVLVQIVSLVWGVLAFLGMMIAFLPYLGPLNWFNVFFAGVGVVLGVIALVTAKPWNRGIAIAAVVANGVAAAIGVVRLIFGTGGL
jgi:hypothetical protein